MGNFADRIRLTGLSLKPVTHDYCSTTDYSTASEVREPAVTYGNTTLTTHASVIQATINQIQQRNTTTNNLTTNTLLSGSQLAQRLNNSTTIYLDTTYWLLIRDAFLGKSADPHLNTLSQQLLQITEHRAVLFPLSIDTLLDVISDTDEASIPATLDLLQSLSQGICLLPFVTRASREVECYLAKQLIEADHLAHRLSPTPPAYMDFISWFNEVESNLLESTSYQSHLNTPYRETLVDCFLCPKTRQKHLTLLKRFATPAESTEFKTFPKLDAYRQELAQSLQYLQPYIIQQLKKSDWLMVAGSPQQQNMAYRVLISFLYDHWNQPAQREQFLKSSPSLYVNVLTLAAAYCGDNTDLLPHFIHAQAAIGHCDYYFSRLSVEQALCWLPDQSVSHHLMTDFNCHFSCDTSEILGLLQKLYDKQQHCFL